MRKQERITTTRIDLLTLRELTAHPSPSVRFLALTRLMGRPVTAPEVMVAWAQIPRVPPVRAILEAQYPAGYWMRPRAGRSPRYRTTLWQLLFLAQLGMGPCPSIAWAVEAVLGQDALLLSERLSTALRAALLWALIRLGYGDEPRLKSLWAELEAAPVTEPPAAIWTLRAAAAAGRKDALAVAAAEVVRLAVERGTAGTSALTFPLTGEPDRLAALQALCEVGLSLPEGEGAWLTDRRLPGGYWPLEARPGPLWWDPGRVGAANPWVTLRALQVRLEGGDQLHAEVGEHPL